MSKKQTEGTREPKRGQATVDEFWRAVRLAQSEKDDEDWLELAYLMAGFNSQQYRDYLEEVGLCH